MKTCTKCSRELEESSFGKRKTGLNGLQSKCKECMNLAARLSKFNMSEDDLNLLVEKQTVGGILLCAVCGGTEPDVIDHDHETGKVRGLLHDKCNSGLGAFHDDPELLQVASSYLVNAMNKFAEQTFKELDDL